MKTDFLKDKMARGIIFLALALGLWEALYQAHVFNRCLWPSVSGLGQTFVSLVFSVDFQRAFVVTMARLVFGFLTGAGLALVLGFACILFKGAAFFLEPLVYLSFPVPRFILLPFIMILFGAGWVGGAVFLGMGAFYPLIINMLEGYRRLSRDHLDIARHYGARGIKLCCRVIWPGLLPSIFAGLRIGFGLTVTYTIILEYLSSNTGLGGLMWLSLQTLQIDRLLVSAIVVAVLNMTVILFLAVLERRLMPWAYGRE
jgi:NitT/TauT family transport system permease protein